MAYRYVLRLFQNAFNGRQSFLYFSSNMEKLKKNSRAETETILVCGHFVTVIGSKMPINNISAIKNAPKFRNSSWSQ